MTNKSIWIAHIEGQMELCKMWSEYWIHFANTHKNLQRNIKDGTGREFTEAEKIDDAMNTAKTHIHRYNELLEKKIEILNEKGE